MQFFILAVMGIWLIVEGIIAALFVYPPAFWVVVRILRILLGGALLLEARRVRLTYHYNEKEDRRRWKLRQGYIDLLTIVGLWSAVDGIGTGFLGYVYPIITWQVIRIVRIAIGAALVLGGLYFTPKLRTA